MNLLERYNTVFFRMIIVNLLLAIVTTSAVGAICYFYFTATFNGEVVKVNRHMLERLGSIIEETVIKRAEGISIEVTSNLADSADLLHLINHPVEHNYGKVIGAFNCLRKAALSNPDLIASIEVYFIKNNIIISSAYGLKFVELELHPSPIDASWIDNISTSDYTFIWTRTAKENVHQDLSEAVFSFIKTYPYTTPGRESKAYIRINVRESALHKIIKQPGFDTVQGMVFIMNQNGSVISHSNNERLFDNAYSNTYASRILDLGKTEGSFIDILNDTESMVTYTTLQHNGWYIVNTTPLVQYYEKTGDIRRTMLLVCLATLLVALAIASIFTFKIYNPLKVIVSNIISMFSGTRSSVRKACNEYVIIDNAINKLSGKVMELELSLESNKPLIKFNLITRLLANTIRSQEEFIERMKLSGMKMDLPYFRVLYLEMDACYFGNISIENGQLVRYNLISRIESFGNVRNICHASEISDSELAIIVNTIMRDADFILMLAGDVINYAFFNYALNITASIGTCAENALCIYDSYNAAKAYIKYRYFMPNCRIFTEMIATERDTNPLEVPYKFIDEFLTGLRLQNLERVRTTLEAFSDIAEKGKHSAAACHRRITEIISAYSGYVRDLGYSLHNILNPDVLEQFQYINSMDEFCTWMLQAADIAIKYVKDKRDDRNSDIICSIKSYISDNLAGDLSLNTVAEKVFLSPTYFSKIFKEETGITFIDYVNVQRLENAKCLILTTDLNNEEISERSGFTSSSYFISRFKKYYGTTPRNYKAMTVSRSLDISSKAVQEEPRLNNHPCKWQ